MADAVNSLELYIVLVLFFFLNFETCFIFQGRADEMRKVPVPAHRYTPLKENWLKIFTPIVEHLQLQVRFNLKTRNVEIKVSVAYTFFILLGKLALMTNRLFVQLLNRYACISGMLSNV